MQAQVQPAQPASTITITLPQLMVGTPAQKVEGFPGAIGPVPVGQGTTAIELPTQAQQTAEIPKGTMVYDLDGNPFVLGRKQQVQPPAQPPAQAAAFGAILFDADTQITMKDGCGLSTRLQIDTKFWLEENTKFTIPAETHVVIGGPNGPPAKLTEATEVTLRPLQ